MITTVKSCNVCHFNLFLFFFSAIRDTRDLVDMDFCSPLFLLCLAKLKRAVVVLVV